MRAQAYELRRVYYQGIRDGKVARVDVKSLSDKPPAGFDGPSTQYMALFSSRYHSQSGPVIVRPKEVYLVSMTDEVKDAALLAIPGLFWVWLAYTIYSYGEANGGIFSTFSKRM